MRENEPVLPVLSVCEREIILEKGGILSEKRQLSMESVKTTHQMLVLVSGVKVMLQAFLASVKPGTALLVRAKARLAVQACGVRIR